MERCWLVVGGGLVGAAVERRWQIGAPSWICARVVAALAITLAVPPSAAFALDALVTWSPVQSAAGYKIYVRSAANPFTDGLDVGAPAPSADGSLRYTLLGISNGVVNYFAVTAYDAAGRESAFSNQLSLPVSPTPTPTNVAATPTPECVIVAGVLACFSDDTPTPTPTVTATPSAATTAGHEVAGEIFYYGNGMGVSDIDVLLTGTTSRQSKTDAAGRFAFREVQDGTWRLEPRKSGDFEEAISSLDASYALQFSVGQRDLDEASRLACDVTGDGTVTSLDAARILQFAVGIIDRFPVAEQCDSDWAFLPLSPATPHRRSIDPLPETASCRPGAVEFDPLSDDAAGLDFAAVLFGDCTGNW